MSDTEVKNRMRILIGGSGFAGVKLALLLQAHKKFEVTLISTKPNFEYHSALYRAATGRSPLEVVLPLSSIFDEKSTVNIVQDTISEISVADKEVISDTGHHYKYDEAYLSFGAVPNYYGIEGMDENSFSIDSIADTIKLRRHLHEITVNSDQEKLNFVVVGGGASGVELAAELPIYVKKLCKHHNIPKKIVDVILIEGSDHVLPLLDEKLSDKALQRLKKLDVKVLLNRRVTGRDLESIITEDMKFDTQTVIWTAGAKNNPFYANNTGKFRLADNSKVVVDEYMMANKDIYVLGDSANTKYSGMAQTALHDAIYAADSLIARTEGKNPDKYKDKKPIYVVPVGGQFAVLQWGKLKLSGYTAWILRRLADLRLFLYLQPFKRAIKTWRHANRRAKEICEFCDTNE